MFTYTIHHRPLYDTCALGTPIEPATYFDLPHLDVLAVKGDHALSFLQGQLTCDVLHIEPKQSLQGALCNLKGRILALMEVIRFHEAVLLVLPIDCIALVKQDLKLAAQLSRVTFENSALSCMGYYAPYPPADIPHYAIAPNLYLCLSESKPETQRGNLPWQALCIAAQRFSIYPETSALFLPEHVGLDKTNTVSFTKGCYKGQEIIARMHYRGTHKYQLKTLPYESETPLLPGQNIPEGEIIDLAPTATHQFLLNISTTVD